MLRMCCNGLVKSLRPLLLVIRRSNRVVG
jgi:hypothetical protein